MMGGAREEAVVEEPGEGVMLRVLLIMEGRGDAMSTSMALGGEEPRRAISEDNSAMRSAPSWPEVISISPGSCCSAASGDSCKELDFFERERAAQRPEPSPSPLIGRETSSSLELSASDSF